MQAVHYDKVSMGRNICLTWVPDFQTKLAKLEPVQGKYNSFTFQQKESSKGYSLGSIWGQ